MSLVLAQLECYPRILTCKWAKLLPAN